MAELFEPGRLTDGSLPLGAVPLDGAASVSIRRFCAASEAHSALRAATFRSLARPARAFDCRQCGCRPAALRRFLNRSVDLALADDQDQRRCGGQAEPCGRGCLLRLGSRLRSCVLPPTCSATT
jgi:hypothetical protein